MARSILARMDKFRNSNKHIFSIEFFAFLFFSWHYIRMANYFSMFDQKMMQEAFKEAKKAFDKDEVPVGAVLTLGDKIIARSHNLVESKKDPTAHAELLCIQKGAKIIQDWRLLKGTLYTTLEPCVMCGGAMLLARLARVVWAAPDLRHGANGSWIDLFRQKHPTHQLEIIGGLYQDEGGELMRLFFKRQRKKHGTKNRKSL